MTMLHHIQQNWFVTFGQEVLLPAAYSPDLAPSDYHFFASMDHAFAEQRCGSHKDVKKWFAGKGEDFYREIARKMGKMYNKRWLVMDT